ncbi:MAG TPA: Holliday junction branch migration protein RuvA [Solirubrobacteraceae bacterium]|jgi:Holliday junction DNA helicase RuvA|nr:Holliday junction branch migration protein RuvA [Solirubrobacteraceae bacterium]
MIALVRGEVLGRRPDHVVVGCGGVGYRLAVSTETLRHVPSIGHEATLHAHLIVRDDALALFGFATEEERELFLMLITVQNVGPKVALAVLGGGSPRDLTAAIAAGDGGRFQAVPGIGKRTAERIITELRDKVLVDVSVADASIGIVARRGPSDARALAREGLLELGFAPLEAEQLLAGADGTTAEALIGEALRAARR